MGSHCLSHVLGNRWSQVVHHRLWEQSWPHCTWCIEVQMDHVVHWEQGRPLHSMYDLCSYRELCLFVFVLFLQKSKDENSCNSYKIYAFSQTFMIPDVRTLHFFSLSNIPLLIVLLLTISTVCLMVLLNGLFPCSWSCGICFSISVLFHWA
jgi:hypothetical protein